MVFAFTGKKTLMNKGNAYLPLEGFKTILLLSLISVVMALVTEQYTIMLIVPALLVLVFGMQFPKLLFYALIFTIPVSFEVMITPKLGTDIPDEFIMWLLTAILPLIIIARPGFFKNLMSHQLTILLTAGLCWTLITILNSTHPLFSIKYFLAKVWYIIPFFTGTVFFLADEKSIIRAAKCLVIPMSAVAAFIVARHALTGFSFEQVNDMARPVFRNHVNYAALLVCVLPVSYALYRNAEKSKRIWLLITIFLTVALFFSYARGSWLAFAVALITMSAMIKNRLSWLFVGVAVLIIGFFIFFVTGNRYLNYRPVYEKTVYHSSFNEHLEATYAMRDLSTAERVYRWIAAFRMSKEKLLTGYGPNTFYFEYKPFTVSAFTTYVSSNDEHSTVHNYFLLLLTEQGIPGLVLFTTLYLAMLMMAQRIYHQSTNTFEKGLMLLVTALLSMIGVLIFLSDLIETDKIGSIFYICLGLLVGGNKARQPLHQVHPEVHSQED